MGHCWSVILIKNAQALQFDEGKVFSNWKQMKASHLSKQSVLATYIKLPCSIFAGLLRKWVCPVQLMPRDVFWHYATPLIRKLSAIGCTSHSPFSVFINLCRLTGSWLVGMVKRKMYCHHSEPPHSVKVHFEGCGNIVTAFSEGSFCDEISFQDQLGLCVQFIDVIKQQDAHGQNLVSCFLRYPQPMSFWSANWSQVLSFDV